MNGVTAIVDYLYTYYDEVEPLEFYRDIFPAGELEKAGERVPGAYTGILVHVTKEKRRDGKTLVKRRSVTDDLEAIREACATDDFCLMSPISYAGKERKAENARFMYAIAVDVDRLRAGAGGEPVGLRSLLERHIDLLGRVPKPSYIVASGTGVHLYYLLDKPIAMYPETAKQLQALKRDLTDLIWHDTVCDILSKQDIQQEGIYQGFRIPGTITKNGSRARVFRVGDRVTLDHLNSFVSHPVTMAHEKRGMTLLEAKSRYPEWYERRVVRGEPRGSWHVSRRVYDWWKRQILTGATVGHRYYCLMMLSIYAQKCSFYDAKKNPNPVTRDELEADALELMDIFDALTVDENNHFTTDDMMQALEAFEERWISYPRAAIEYKSGIRMEPVVNRRPKGKRLKQAIHLTRARLVQSVDYPDGSWRNMDGRPTAQKQVQEWREKNPSGRKIDCERDTGLSRHSVLKWWDVDKDG